MPREATKPWIRRTWWALGALAVLLLATMAYALVRGEFGEAETPQLPERLRQREPEEYIPR